MINIIKELLTIKKRENTYKGIQQMKEYCDQLVAEGRMTEEQKSLLIAEAAKGYAQMHV